MNAAQLTRLTEQEARDLLESIRWPNGPICPKCGSINAKKMGGKAGEKGQCKCRDCRKSFTVRVGTIFEDSPIPLRDWVYAFTRMCASKKGISAHQIHRELDITYKSAWFMCHRIRHAMADDGALKLEGKVESDETYVGGKPRKIAGKGAHGRQGCTDKTPVHTLVERGGRKYTRVLANVRSGNLKANIDALVDENAEMHTDEGAAYGPLSSGFKGGHKVVNHSQYEYFRKADGAGINEAESSFALIKRGVYGTFHHVSKKHLQRYCDEFDFRWNQREVDDVTRTLVAIGNGEGKRLLYRQPAS